jgi:thiamine-phosphate pyrophosphorylase
MDDRRRRLEAARLYLVCDAQGDEFLRAALRGGVDIVQLRMKDASDDDIRVAASRFARICTRHGALFILNDRPDLAASVGADGVHVGQDDVPVLEARRIVGAERIIGLSTHTEQQIDDAGAEVDYIGVGPVHETPTKPGRPAVGVELVRYAARRARVPFFAIGGLNARNAAEVRRAGATRIVVVRALTEAAEAEHVARDLRAAIVAEPSEVHVGTT